jgi:hypothetical protein
MSFVGKFEREKGKNTKRKRKQVDMRSGIKKGTINAKRDIKEKKCMRSLLIAGENINFRGTGEGNIVLLHQNLQ